MRSAANSFKSRWAIARRALLCSGNCRSRRKAYPAVCGKRATLPGEVGRRGKRAEPTKPLAVKRPGIRAGEMQRDTSRVLDRLGFAALNPFYGGAIAHAAEGDSVAYSASSGGVGWVERSKTHRMNQRRGGAGGGVAA